MKDKGNEIKKSDYYSWIAVAVILGVALFASVLTSGFGVNKVEPVTYVLGLEIEERNVLGDANAPVTILVWSDFECPYCSEHATKVHPQIVEKYVKSGQAKIVFRHYPIMFHSIALPSAVASECAGEQGKFWEYHDALFAKSVEGQINDATLILVANELKLDSSDFNKCIVSDKYLEVISSDVEEGKQAQIQATPTSIINGRVVKGAQPFTVFEKIIDEEIKKATSK